MSEKKDKLPIIGPSALVSIGKRAIDVPAKIDTGAEASSIWASKIRIDKDGVLKFALFGEGSPFYNGKIFKRTEYKAIVTRSAMGQEQIRYRVYMPVKINGRKIRVLFSLADRSKNSFPILIGKRTLQGKFVVDVSLPDIEYKRKPKEKEYSLKEFKKNPYKFHKKYVKGQ
ncbi:ATP-dependent zinc protease [Candidatus Saccharibacteria bacterium]|nr:ATP-dependent zinc protease [Candidatus Saccharibacteria bacterium]